MAPSKGFTFHDKHTLVTGAASGIGFELCKLMLKMSAASVAMIDIERKQLFEAAEQLQSQGTQTRISTFVADVSREAEVMHPVAVRPSFNMEALDMKRTGAYLILTAKARGPR